MIVDVTDTTPMFSPRLTWRDRDRFVLGDIYIDDSDVAYEYVGFVAATVAHELARSRGLPGPIPDQMIDDESEPFDYVLLFRDVVNNDGDPTSYVVHRRRDDANGLGFQQLADRLQDDAYISTVSHEETLATLETFLEYAESTVRNLRRLRDFHRQQLDNETRQHDDD